MWMGSDLSTSDEWVEITSDGPEAVDISGWTLTSLNSKGEHTLMVRFVTGSLLDAEQVMIIANLSASSSRLLSEPDVVTTAMSLPNTKLLLTLRNAEGTIVDQVDDGVGSPFAGANPSGGTKASMERVALSDPGTVSTNWRTATESSGFDPGVTILGSPGFFAFPSLPPSDPPPTPSCIDPLEVSIYVQDGSLTGVGHTTVNFQAVAVRGSITTAVCRWVFSDGYSSDSCNPPPHAFTQVGTTSVNLEAINQCGNTLKQELKVEVLPDPMTASTSDGKKVVSQYDGSLLLLSSALPNPEGSETGHEWVEIRNAEERPTNLAGWSLRIGKTSIKTYSPKGVIDSWSRLRLYNSELKFSLPNTESEISLVNPLGATVSTIRWKVAEEGVEYLADDIRDLEVTGRVLSVIDGDTFVLGLEGKVRELLDTDSIHVRLLGIDAPELLNSTQFSYEALEYLSALINKKRVELSFDSDIWDRYGRLLAYISTEDSRDPARELLSMGLASVKKAFAFSALEEYRTIEASAKDKKIGIWSLPVDSELGISKSKEVEPSLILHETSDNLEVPLDPSSIIISEIYSSPSVVNKSYGALPKENKLVFEQNNSSILQSEWIEIGSSTDARPNLTQWKLSVNGKVKSLSSGLEWGSNGFLVIDLTPLKLHLRNDGTIVSLLSPDGVEVSSVLYPALKSGYSYAYLASNDEYCITTSPTPRAVNICRSPVPKVRASTLKKQAKITAYARDLKSSDGEVISLQDSGENEGFPHSILFLLSLFMLSCIFLIIVRYRKV